MDLCKGGAGLRGPRAPASSELTNTTAANSASPEPRGGREGSGQDATHATSVLVQLSPRGAARRGPEQGSTGLGVTGSVLGPSRLSHLLAGYPRAGADLSERVSSRCRLTWRGLTSGGRYTWFRRRGHSALPAQSSSCRLCTLKATLPRPSAPLSPAAQWAGHDKPHTHHGLRPEGATHSPVHAPRAACPCCVPRATWASAGLSAWVFSVRGLGWGLPPAWACSPGLALSKTPCGVQPDTPSWSAGGTH